MIPLGVLAARRPAAGGAWSPTDLGASLAAWYDAADETTITGGFGDVPERVAQWDDKSGNARHAIAESGATYTTGSTINGLNAIAPSGTRSINVASLTLPQPYTVALVAKANATSSYIVSVALAEGTCYAVSVHNTPSWRIRNGSDLSGGTPNTSPHVMVGVHDGASSLIRIDGTQVASGNAGTSNPAKIIIGGAVSTSSSARWNGLLGEIVIASGALTGSDLTNLETYLADKWGL